MKKQDLYEILDEIYLVDASLKQDEKKLIDMLTLFSKSSPNIKPSLQFKKELKQVILLETMKKREKLQFFSYIKMASFILSGAVGVYLSFFIFAPFFNQDTIIIPPENIQTKEENVGEINKVNEVVPETNENTSSSEKIITEDKVENAPIIIPDVKKQDKVEKSLTKEPEVRKTKSFQTTIIQKGEIAFGKIAGEGDTSLPAPAQMSLMVSDESFGEAASDSMAFSKMAPTNDVSTLQEAPPEENIPIVEKKYTFEGNLVINIPEKMNVYKNVYKEGVPFVEEKIDEYTFMYDFNRNTLSLFKEYTYENDENIRYNFRDSEVKQSIFAFTNKYGVDISIYGDPEVLLNGIYSNFIPGNEREGSEKIITIRLPLLIDGKEVYTDFGDKIGTYISYDVSKKSIISFSDITYTNREKSLYSLNQDIKNILKTDGITAGVIYSYENLKNPTLIYVLKNDFYIPALKFITDNGENKIFELVK